MPDSRFFKKAGPFTLQQLAEITQTEIGPHSDAGAVYENVGSLQDGTDKDVSFLLSKKYVADLEKPKRACVSFPPNSLTRSPKLPRF